MQLDQCAEISALKTAARAVEERYAIERQALLDRKHSVYQAINAKTATWADAQLVEDEWEAFEAQRKSWEAQIVEDAKKIIKRQARVKLNQRVRKFVTSYVPPAQIRGETLSVQAVYLAIAKTVVQQKRNEVELCNGQIVGIAGVSKASVKRATARLVELGVIEKINRKVRHLNLPNIYKLATKTLLSWAQKIFGRGRLTTETQSRTGFIPVPTQAQKTADMTPDESQNSCRLKANENKAASVVEDRDHYEAFERLAKLALEEVGRPITTNAGPSAVTQAVDRVRRERIGQFRSDEWQRFRRVHGRKADLALLETVMLEDIRDGKIASDRPKSQRFQIKDPARYLHGILARRRDECRPHVTLGRLLETRKREIPGAIKAAIAAYQEEKSAGNRWFSGQAA